MSQSFSCLGARLNKLVNFNNKTNIKQNAHRRFLPFAQLFVAKLALNKLNRFQLRMKTNEIRHSVMNSAQIPTPLQRIFSMIIANYFSNFSVSQAHASVFAVQSFSKITSSPNLPTLISQTTLKLALRKTLPGDVSEIAHGNIDCRDYTKKFRQRSLTHQKLLKINSLNASLTAV